MDEDFEAKRRPILARQWAVSQHAVTLLAPLLTPNQISLLSIVFALLAALAFAAPAKMTPLMLVLAAMAIESRMICNLLDGMVAVARGTTSAVGALFNDAPDRVSDSLILISLGFVFEFECFLWATLMHQY